MNFVVLKENINHKHVMKTFYNNPVRKFFTYPVAFLMFFFGAMDLKKLLKNQ